MRSIVLAGSLFILAACGEQAPTPAPDTALPAADAIEAAGPQAAPANGVEVAPPSLIAPTDVPGLIEGKWVSVDDPKATVTITADGIWTDGYSDGSPLGANEWRAIFGGEAQKAAPTETFTPTATYLEVTAQGEPPRYYELGAVGEDTLEMFYVGRGNRLAYNRVK